MGGSGGSRISVRRDRNRSNSLSSSNPLTNRVLDKKNNQQFNMIKYLSKFCIN